MAPPLPIVAIIGRANVGKSTLFNRLTGTRRSIVNDRSGVTRDRIYGQVTSYNKPFIIIDTGGIDLDGGGTIENQVLVQGDIAIAEADAVVFIADGRQGPTPQDEEVIQKLRKSGKPFYIGVNKIDSQKQELDSHEFFKLGLTEVYPISAEHGLGIDDLMTPLVEALPLHEVVEEKQQGIRLAIIGRPNVGKSSLINRLLMQDRCIVSEIPGTTRDSVDTVLKFEDSSFILTDTAGIRRKGKTRHVLEKFSVIMALKVLERSDIAVLLIDAVEGVTDQDATIAGYAHEEGRGVILCVNKWDLASSEDLDWKEVEAGIRNKLKFLEFAPIMPISARTGKGLPRFLPEVERVYKEYTKTISTSRLNDCFAKAIQRRPMSSFRGRFLKLFYATQIKNRPPTFQCFVNYPEGIHFSYERYLLNSLRSSFGFEGTPIRLLFASRHPGSSREGSR